MQTGVQILTGFLLTVPFSTRFDDLDPHQRWLFLAILAGSVATTLIIVAPVSFHRTLFRRRQRDWLVAAGHLCARAGLLLFSLVTAGVIMLVFDVVAGPVAGVVSAVVAVSAFALIWYGVPQLIAHRLRRDAAGDTP